MLLAAIAWVLLATPILATIGVAKKATTNGREVTLDFFLENLGGSSLSSIELADDLDAVFGAGNYTLLQGPTLVDDPGTLTVNGSFNGGLNPELLLGGTLSPAATAQIRIVVEVTVLSDQGMGAGVYSNQVTARAEEGALTDLSDNGTDPDPNGNGDPTESGENDPTPIDLNEITRIGVAKAASLSGSQVTLDFVLESFANVTLGNLSLTDDLDAVFGAGNYTLLSGPTLIDDPGTLVVNASFDGSTDTELIASGTLAMGATAGIRIVVDITNVTDRGAGFGVYSNQVTATGDGPGGGTAADLSDSGVDPDSNGDGDATDPDEGDPTVFVVGEEPALGVAKDSAVTGSDVTLDFHLENLGNVAFTSVSLADDLDAVFGPGNFTLLAPPVLLVDPGTLTVNVGFDGSADPDLIASGSLAVGVVAQIRIAVRVLVLTDQGSGVGNYQNQITVFGTTAAGALATDLSDSGTDPDPNGNGDPGEMGEDDPTTFSASPSPVIGAAKEVSILPNASATVDVGGTPTPANGPRVVVTLHLENLGNVELSNLTLTDDLDAVFGAGNYGTVIDPQLPEVIEGDNINPNSNYNGSTDTAVLAAGSTLSPLANAILRFEVIVIDVGAGSFQNQATATGEGPAAGMTSDLSDAGSDPDPNGNGDPTGAGEDDPTGFILGSLVGAAKTASVIGNQVTFDLFLENFGTVTLSNLSLIDDLDAVFGAGTYVLASPPVLIDDPGTLTLNGSYDGSGDAELLAPGGTLNSGDTAQIRFVAALDTLVNRGSGLGAYANQATASAEQPGGQILFDFSDSGTDPDPNGNGDPRDLNEDDATSFVVLSDAVVGAAKDAAVAGTEVTLDIFLENFGSQTSSNLTLTDDLDAAFGAGNYTVSVPPLLIDDPGTLILNGAFDGSGDPDLLVAGSTLAGLETAQIRFVVDLTNVTDQGLGLGLFENQAFVTGTDPSGLTVSDASDAGTDPDFSGDGDPTEPGLADPPVPGENDPTPIVVGTPGIAVAKHAIVSGTTVTLDFYLENVGEVTVENLLMRDPLNPVFGSGNYSVVSQPTVIDGATTVTPSGQFFGFSVFDFVIAGGSLAPGESSRVRVVVNVTTVSDQGMGFGVYSNQVTLTGQAPDGTPTMDLSDAGIVPDANGNGDPGESGEDDPTPIVIGEEARLGVAKDAVVAGSQVTFDLFLENLGNAALSTLDLGEDLDGVFGAGNYSLSGAPALIDDPGTLILNGAYDGSGDPQLLGPGSTLAAGDTAQIRIVVDVSTVTDQGLGAGIYQNQVFISGEAPLGSVAMDFSDDGTDPDPNGNGDPNDPDEADATAFTVGVPRLGVAKDVAVAARDVTLDFYVENLGNLPLDGVSLPDDLDAVFGAGNYQLLGAPVIVGPPRGIVVNPGFNGSSDLDLIGAGSTLGLGVVEQIQIVVRVTNVTDQGMGVGVYSNQVTASAAAGPAMVSDLSDAGTDPDPNGNDDAGDAGEDDPTVIVLGGSVGDFVWNDLDGDGVIDGGEPGLSGVTVFLDLNLNAAFDGGEPSASTVAGAYDIASSVPGTFRVQVDATTLPAGFALTTGNLPLDVVLGAGDDRNDADFGYRAQGDLSITKVDGADPVRPGDPLTYTVEVTNNGPSEVPNVVVVDTLPAGVTFVSTSGCLNDPGGVPTCELGTIAVGASKAYTLSVTVDASTPSGPLTNSATVSSADAADPSPANNTANEDTTVDADPPTVTLVDSTEGDGELEECEALMSSVTELSVTFSESMQDPAGDGAPSDVTNPLNYLLVAAGPDGDFATTVCGPALGDDVGVPIDAVSYDDGPHTAVLQVGGGAPLGDSLYRLLVCGSTSVRDLVGNPLDGNGDGTGGDDFTRSYRIDRTNLLTNGHFDCDLESWARVSTLPSEIEYSPDDFDDSLVSGSAQITNLSASSEFSIGQCVDVPPGLDCQLDMRLRVDAAPGVTLTAVQLCESFAGPACTGSQLGADAGVAFLGDTGGSWQLRQLGTSSPASTTSLLCSLDLRTATGEDFDAFLDQARLECVGPIFADGFESGNTSAWSSTVP